MNCLEMNCPCEVVELCPSRPGEAAYHTEIIVDGELHIPEVKPPAEKLVNITRKICLTKVVRVPVKLDNGCIAGCKVLVVGTIRLGFEYSAEVPEQNVHFVHFDIPFQGLITGRPCHRPIPSVDCNLRKFDLHVCVEHVQADLVNPRAIEKVVVLLLWLKRKHCDHHKFNEHEHQCNPREKKHEHRLESYEKEHDHRCNSHEQDYDHQCGPHIDILEYECEPQNYNHQPIPEHCHGSHYEAEPRSKHYGHRPKPPCDEDLCDQLMEVSKQISINHTLVIPSQKPPAECVLSSSVDIDITKAEVIETPIVDRCHRHLMKVVVTGKAEIKVKYVADVPNQQVHAVIFRVPFEALIEWPDGPPQHTPVCVTATVEHFQVDLLDSRRLFKVLILRLDVTKKISR